MVLNKENITSLLNLLTSSIDDYEETNREKLENYFDQEITKLEGSICSYDKADYLITKMIMSKRTNQNINLYETYQDLKDRNIDVGYVKDEDLHHKCYWIPESFKTTNDAWMWFESKDPVMQEIMQLEID